MSYTTEDPVVRNILGCPHCPKCHKALIYEMMAVKYFCPKCDKDELEQFQNKAKGIRQKIYNKRKNKEKSI